MSSKLYLPVYLLMMVPFSSAQTTTTRTTTASLPSNVQTLWGVCGGDGAPTSPWTKTVCESGSWCTKPNTYLHQCVPLSLSPTATTTAIITTTPPITTTTWPLQTKYGKCGGILHVSWYVS
ncbi:hypothetical protein TWF718_007512 [Orbilia javanica]|uniref:CBM1 domain-containing protein n=1 Tax=Orbilia javanica TaxID=47235 RepID=A0AAN8N0P4_9PEZI